MPKITEIEGENGAENSKKQKITEEHKKRRRKIQKIEENSGKK